MPLPPFTGFYAPCLNKTMFIAGSGSEDGGPKIYDRKAPDTGSIDPGHLL